MRFLLFIPFLSALGAWAAAPEAGPLRMNSVPNVHFHVEGVTGQRIQANLDNWLLDAPAANPGMLEMFRVRDRKPVPKLEPWAGEFVGKYLISGIQSIRTTEDPRLEKTVSSVLRQLLETQAENGYLGPFPEAQQLKGNWDLWGHYHILQALLLWHDRTGDEASMLAARRAADLMCTTFLSGELRVYDIGWHEMNMAVIHVLGRLYRSTGEARYLQLMKEIETDWERAGDYLRTGVAGTEFHRTPRPRWESLPDLQGLMELYRISGEEKYRTAFVNHWRSIKKWDRHHNGSFSTGELALGNPYAHGAIETCCTVAWMALSVDMLQLTGDLDVADELELSTFSGAAGAQHPSGRWYTYNTPMDGVREASAHSIVFQARAGTPELNCCSVNGPRSWSMMPDWMIMEDPQGIWLHSYVPGEVSLKRPDGARVDLQIESEYPLDGSILVKVDAEKTEPFALQFRIPGWAEGATVALNDETPIPAAAGTSVSLHRTWESGDRVKLEIPFRLRYEMGAQEMLNKASIFYGPLNLAYDQSENPMDADQIPGLNLDKLSAAIITQVKSTNPLDPWLRVDVDTTGGLLRLVDFASAGSRGTQYVSWLPVNKPPPPPAQPRQPKEGESISADGYVFKWVGSENAGGQAPAFHISLFDDRNTSDPVFSEEVHTNSRVFSNHELANLHPGKNYYWTLEAKNEYGSNTSQRMSFRVNQNLPVHPEVQYFGRAKSSPLVDMVLDEKWKAAVGAAPEGFTLADGQASGTKSVNLNGVNQRVHFDLGHFPEQNFTLQLDFNVAELPTGRMGQVASAWVAGLDDPMRVTIENGKLSIRVEAGLPSVSPGIPVTPGEWIELSVVKEGRIMRLYTNGVLRETVSVPYWNNTKSRGFSLGGNPLADVNEFLAARYSKVRFFGCALTEADLQSPGK